MSETTVPAPAAPGGVQPAAPAGPAASAAKVLRGLGCPSCGGSLEAQEGWTNFLCRYCNTSLLVSGSGGYPRLMVLDRVDRATALQSAKRWLGSGLRKAPGLDRAARVDESFLAWFPFVRTRFDVVGWVFGTERRRRNKRTIEVPREIQVERTIDRTRPAGEMAEFGVGRVNLAGDALVPFDAERLKARGMVFRPTIEPEEAERSTTSEGMDQVAAGARLNRVTYAWLKPVRRSTSVVYYPLWVIRYSFRERTYQVLIDADDGSLAYGQAPSNTFLRAMTLVASVAAACFVGTSFLQHGVLFSSRHDNDSVGALVALLAACGGAIYWGYRRFRYGSVLVEGSGAGPEPIGLPEALRQVMGKIR